MSQKNCGLQVFDADVEFRQSVDIKKLLLEGTALTITAAQLNTLGESVVSEAMAPVVSAENLAAARLAFGLGLTSEVAFGALALSGAPVNNNQLTITNTSSTGYARPKVVNDAGYTWTFGVGGSAETVYGVANKFYIFDFSKLMMRFVIDDDTGNVGIGTATPAYKLDVAGSLHATSIENALALVGATNTKAYLSAAGTSLAVTASEVNVASALGGATTKLASFSKTVDISTVGAGGMDTGTAPASGYVSIYAIYNPTTATTSILATSEATSNGEVYTGANLPSGYTKSALLGVWPTNSSSQFKKGLQIGRKINLEETQVLNAGTSAGSTSIDISSVVPSKANSVRGTLQSGATNTYSQVSSISGAIGQTFVFASSGTTASPFTLDIEAAQTMYYVVSSGGSLNVYLTGYSF